MDLLVSGDLKVLMGTSQMVPLRKISLLGLGDRFRVKM